MCITMQKFDNTGQTQGSYRSSTVKFPDFSLTFQVME